MREVEKAFQRYFIDNGSYPDADEDIIGITTGGGGLYTVANRLGNCNTDSTGTQLEDSLIAAYLPESLKIISNDPNGSCYYFVRHDMTMYNGNKAWSSPDYEYLIFARAPNSYTPDPDLEEFGDTDVPNCGDVAYGIGELGSLNYSISAVTSFGDFCIAKEREGVYQPGR